MADKNGGYIGNSPSDSSVTIARQAYTSSGITTDFTFTSGYTPGYLDAYLNGVRLIETDDYVATDGTILSLTTAAQNGDTLELIAYKAFNVSDFTLQTEVGGNFDVSNNLTVGGNLDVDGTTELDVLNVAETATFTGAIDANSNLDVDGHTELDDLNVSGVTTVGGLLDINAGAQANTLKVEDLTDNRVVITGTGGELEDDANFTFDGTQLALGVGLTVTGVSTFASAVDINSSIDVDGHTELDDLNVSGVATVASLSVTGNISIGGTLTYEDVTNVDSIGLITARTGIKVLNSGGVQVATGATINGETNIITALTNGSERLRIKSDGTIGIGTNDPSSNALVEIQGGAGGKNTRLLFNSKPVRTTGSIGEIFFRNNDDSVAYIICGHDGANDAGNLSFATQVTGGSLTEKLRITSAGNVGIKTTAPNNTLTVGDGVQTSYAPSTAGNYLEIARTSGADAGLLINKNTGQWLVGIDNSDGVNAPLRFEYGAAGSAHPGFGAGTLGMIIKHDGKIGIGTNIPAGKLEVAGTIVQSVIEYPTIRPTLDLNFAATKSLDRRITFTRDSVGTFVDELGIIKYASNNVPRFDHDPTTGESLGLLIEESRTNILGLSSDLTDNNGNDWDNINGTIAVNQTTAPDGTTTAASFTASAGNAEHSVVFAELVPTGNVTVSVWVKTNTYSIVSFVLYGEANSTVSYNISTKTVYNQGSNVSRATITEYPNGWYRISATMNCTVVNSRTFRLFASTGNFNAGGTESFYYWGPQLESGSFETSYIPTYVSNTSVTRGAENAKITGTNFTDFHNATEGTLYGEYKATLINNAPYLVMLSDGTNNNRTIINTDYTAYQGVVKYNDGTNQAVIDGGTPTPGGNNKTALAFKKDDFALSLNGGTVATDTSGEVSINNMMTIGSRHSADSFVNTTIKSIKYYNKRLPNAQLQGLTQQ